MREKTVRKTVRFSPEEAEKLELIAKAKGITVSELIRNSVLGIPIPERISPERLIKRNRLFGSLLYEINKIGVNLNQITKHCNQYREVDILVLEKVVETERVLKELVEKIYEEFSEC